MATKQIATKWIKRVFTDDILKEYNDGFDKDFLRIMPSMTVSNFNLVYNYYTGEELVNTVREGTAYRVYMELSKFVEHFYKVINTEKSDVDNIYSMIRETIEKKKGNLLIAYFCLCQDRIKYANFIDIRMVLHKLYNTYAESYNAEKGIDNRAEALKAISLTGAKFEQFAIQQEAKALAHPNYVKEFFNG